MWRWGERKIIYLSLHCHTRMTSALIKVGSDESHFNVSLIVRDKVTRQCPQTTTFEEKGEPKQIRAAEVRPLLTCQTGSRDESVYFYYFLFFIFLKLPPLERS